MTVDVFEASGSQTGHPGRPAGYGIPAAVAQSLDKQCVGIPGGPVDLCTNPGGLWVFQEVCVYSGRSVGSLGRPWVVREVHG